MNKIIFKLLAIIGIIFFIVSSGSLHAKEINYHNALIAFINLTNDRQYQTFVDDWMRAFRPNIWRQYANDEFELEDRRSEMKEIINGGLNSFVKDEEFEILTSANFGSYDFEDQIFELAPFSKTTYFKVGVPRGGGVRKLPHEFSFKFENPDVLNGFPMSKKEAKQFLKSRKYASGSINKNLNISVTAKPIKANQHHEIILRINKIQIIDSKNANKILYVIQGSDLDN